MLTVGGRTLDKECGCMSSCDRWNNNSQRLVTEQSSVPEIQLMCEVWIQVRAVIAQLV